jgi:hypothetical protein
MFLPLSSEEFEKWFFIKAIMQQLLLIKLNELASNEGVSHLKITAVL